jgi:hypothetical protein
MRVIKVVTFALVVFFILFGCKKDDEDTSITTVNYRYPLTIGNTWTYLKTFQAYDVQSDSTVVIIDTVYVEIDSAIQSPVGENCLRAKYRYASYDDGDFSYEYLVNRGNGLYSLGWKDIFGVLPIKGNQTFRYSSPFNPGRKLEPGRSEVWLPVAKLLMPYTFNVGTNWTTEENDYLLGSTCIIEPGISVIAPVGTFVCNTRKTTVLFGELDLIYYTYFGAPGVVKFSYEFVDKPTDMYGNIIGEFPGFDKYELMGYDLN